MLAFKPKPQLFIKCCMNCKYSKVVRGMGSSPLGYICGRKEGSSRLFGSHVCDVEVDGTGEQLSIFDEMKENVD